MRRFVQLLLFALMPAVPAVAQAPQAPSCAGPEYRTLDFWVGDWIAQWDSSPGTPKGTGANRITRDEYGECVITEHFRTDDGTVIGHSVSTYRPGLKQWRQTWVDNQGGYFDLVGGPVSGADYIFVLENKRATDAQPFLRMIWQDVKPDSFTWRWQRRAKADEPWVDSWVIHYRRKPAASTSR